MTLAFGVPFFALLLIAYRLRFRAQVTSARRA